MTGLQEPTALSDVQQEIESFLASLRHPTLLEDGAPLVDLATAHWRLRLEFNKLIFEAWNSWRSVARRIEEIAYRDQHRITVLARKPAARQSSTLEFREMGRVDNGHGITAGLTGSNSRHEFLAMLAREFPGWRFERVSDRSDREHSFSSWYTRGWARRGTLAWAFLCLREEHASAAADAVLAFGLIWLDWLRRQPMSGGRVTFSGLKLFLPRAAVEVAAHRAAYLDPCLARVEIMEWPAPQGRPAPIDLKDFGNVETRLAPRRQGEALVERHRGLIGELLAPLGLAAEPPPWMNAGDAPACRSGSAPSAWFSSLSRQEPSGHLFTGRSQTASSHDPLAASVDVTPDAARNLLSLRVRGLEFARIEGETSPKVCFGCEGSWQRLDEGNRPEFQDLVRQVTRFRRAWSPDTSNPLYRAHGERWLESLLVRDLSKIDPALLPDYVYPQVPAFSGPALSAAADEGAVENGEPSFDPAEPSAAAFSTTATSPMTRGVIDILSVARGSAPAAYRLAVVELKVHEEINLPLQGLDYWLRVKWLQDRGQFKQFGYFPGLDLSSAPPLLYLVSPAFRFHSTTARLIQYLDPSIDIVEVGINDRWREGIKVLFRRQVPHGLGIGVAANL